MKSNQVILAGGSRFVHDMLYRVIEKAPGIHVAGQVTDLRRLPSVVRNSQAAWIILSQERDSETPSVVEDVLAEHPYVCVLTVSPDGSRVRIRWIESREEELFDLSLDDLISILRNERPKAAKIDLARKVAFSNG